MNDPQTTEQLFELLKGFQKADNNDASQTYRYVIYVRKSTDDAEKQIRSLADQISECEHLAAQLKLKVVKVIEESESAKEPDIRPRFREVLDGVKSKKYDGIIAWHPDRLARNMKDAGEVIDLIDKHIIKDLKFVSFTFENSTSGKMLLGMTFVLSKQYSDSLSDNVNRGNRRSIAEGKYISRPKHGYYKDRNQFLWPDKDNFILLKEAFLMRRDKKTYSEIASYLNKMGYERSNSDSSHSPFHWTAQKIDKILRDPFYAGVVIYGKQKVDLTQAYDFVPMVSVEEFMAINKVSRTSEISKLARRFRTTENVKADLMRGMIICKDCGESMIAGITSKVNKAGKKTNYFYYRCETDDCDMYGKSIRAKVILDYVYAFLAKNPFSSTASYKHYLKEMEHVSDERSSTARTELANLLRKKRIVESRYEKTKNLLLDNIADERIQSTFKDDLDRAGSEIKQIENSIAQKRIEAEIGKSDVLAYGDFLELMENMAKNIRSLKKLSEQDYILRKIYLNFEIQGKEVVNAKLCSPFDELCALNVSIGRGAGN
ncbi:MAG: recombinase family protein [Candidatus Paceibacterota bacterium]